MRIIGIAAGMAVALASGLSAKAASSDTWFSCDGKPKPGSAQALGSRLVRSGLLRMPAGASGPQQASGSPAVAACTEVLADPALAKSWERRIGVLHARAANYADLGNLDAAMADLAAAREASAAGAGDVWFARSTALATDILEAGVLARQGRTQAAETLAVAASDARPYSLGVAGAAARILLVDPSWSSEEDRVLTRLVALEPRGLRLRAAARDWSPLADPAASDWLLVNVLEEEKGARLAKRLANIPEAAHMTPPPDREAWAGAAYALLRADRADEARAFAARLAAPPTPPPNTRPGSFVDFTYERTKHHATVINAALAAREGRLDEAQALIKDQKVFPVSLVTLDLLGRLKEAGLHEAKVDADAARSALREQNARELKAVELLKLVPPAESGVRANVYDGQGGAGLDTTGFKDRAAPGGEGRWIEFAGGGATSGAVSEMMLMRAAELARASGKPGFIIVERTDGERQRHVYSAYGETVTPIGFQSEALVEFVDPAALPAPHARHPERVLMADKVWSDLAPLYTKN
ncbi:MAG TPA: hypothetical protein VD906_11600 [Caulobacteraceae bacterium]|nr:hypothetical protein [Caulobacteraceae bacterium]